MAYTFKHGDRPLEDYTIQRAVGSGGFGEVYYAMSDGGREVALKYLRDNPEIELRGVSHTMNLKSPHLITVFDVKKNAQGQYFIIMEYCSGPSLRDLLIAEPNGFGSQKAAFFVREIGKGLAYLHDRGIVHRDLKPGNIFYDDGYVKIGDYGLSKFISVSRHSAQTASVGTVHYMAPEIGSGNYSRGVDIYALGVILYEMLLGKVPFEGSSMGEVLMKHLTAQPAVDELPAPFAEIIRRALRKDPNDRFLHVHEMVDELLGVDAVRESLAGFSTKSLEGAVRVGGRDRQDSPVPSPNPGFPYQGDFGPGRREAQRSPVPPLPPAPLPDRLAKRLDRISKKVDRRIAKLGGNRVSPPPPARHVVAGQRDGLQVAEGFALPQTVGTAKRFLLCAMLTTGLAIALGLLFGITWNNDEVGASAGMLVTALWGGVVLGQKAVPWFGMAGGPLWAQRLVALVCAGPLLAVGAAPMIDKYGENTLGLLIGLAIVAVFAKWDRELEEGAHGELKFGLAFRAALLALVPTAAVTAGFLQRDPTEFMFLAAAVAGVVSIAMQPTGWWLASTKSFKHLGNPPLNPGYFGAPRTPGPQAVAAGAPPPHRAPQYPMEAAVAASRDADFRGVVLAGEVGWPGTRPQSFAMGSENPNAGSAEGSLERWGITRAFWSVISFALMGGAIVTFLAPLILRNLSWGALQAYISICVACVAGLLFAIRKTTPLRQPTFWREWMRPFVMSLCLAGLGAGITAQCTVSFDRDYERLMSIFGIVMSSIILIIVTLARGRWRPPQIPPFVQPSNSSGLTTDSAGGGPAAVGPTPGEPQPSVGGV